MQLRQSKAREGEQIVDEMRHTLRGRAHSSEMAFPQRVELVGVVFEEGLAEAVDAPQRRAQIVGDRVTKGFELAVDGVGRDVRAPEALLGALHGVDVGARAKPARDPARRIPYRERAPE